MVTEWRAINEGFFLTNTEFDILARFFYHLGNFDVNIRDGLE